MSLYMKERRKNRRNKLISLLGNKCFCGSVEELEFDHINRKTKSFDISGSNLDKPWDILLSEIKKCQLLCKGHHLEKTGGEIMAEHGTTSRFNHRKFPCKCEKCREANNKWRRENYRKKHPL